MSAELQEILDEYVKAGLISPNGGEKFAARVEEFAQESELTPPTTPDTINSPIDLNTLPPDPQSS